MLRNHLSASLRSLARGRIYSIVSIGGLAIGLAAALLCTLVLASQLQQEDFIPGHSRAYLCVSVLLPSGREPDYNAYSAISVAAHLRLGFPGIAAAARLADEEILVRQGRTSARERILWADPDLFEVLPLPVRSGEPRDALRRPDGVVLTRSLARKYFGGVDPAGQRIEIGGHPMTVTAVLEDIPAGSQLKSGIFASGLAASSALTRLDAQPPSPGGFEISVRTFLTLKPGAAIGPVQAAMPALMDRLWPRRPPGLNATMQLVRIDRLSVFEGLNPGGHARLAATAAVGLLILAVALINFVNLSTARAGRRALEVGIRKVSGAGDATLILLFIAESLVGVGLAAVVAVSGVEWLLPPMNAFLDTHATFEYWRHPAFLGWLAVGGLATGIAGAIQPAIVLTAFRPAQVLRGPAAASGGAGVLRQVLVTAQFAILIGLVIAAAVTYRQRQYATGAALRVGVDQVQLLESPCTPALRGELRKLPGVRAVTCTGPEILSGSAFGNVRLKDGGAVAISVFAADPDLLSVYRLPLRAGRFLPPDRDPGSPEPAGEAGAPLRHFVVNEAAVRALGLPSSAAALGYRLELPLGAYAAGTVVGVIPDFSLASIAGRIRPAAYYLDAGHLDLIHIKLAADAPAATLADIDRLGSMLGPHDASQGTAVHRYLLREHLDALYLPVLRQSQLFALFAGLAVALACLGLTGLAAAGTARRTREIGVRKALGAGTGQIMALLLWQLIRPVLWASLLAWPAAALVMSRWLAGFAYHVDLPAGLFVAATGLAIVLALLTVSTQCYLVARTRPVSALRHE